MICFFGDDFSVIGGVETTTFNLKKELENRYELHTDIYSLNKTMDSPEFFYHLPKKNKIKYFSIIICLYHLHRKGYKQIVTSYFAYNIINILMSKIFGYKSIVQEHASSKSYKNSKLLFIICFYRFANNFIVLNEFDKSFYEQKGLHPVKLSNCYSYRKCYSNAESRNSFLILSRLDDNKRVHMAIESWILYKKKGGNFPLIIVGDGPCFHDLNDKYKDFEIKFIGSSRDIENFLCNARSLLVTSKLECYPTVVIEGKYTGTPSLAFNVPSGLKDVINSGVDGVLIEDGNCELMAKHMLDLDSDFNLSTMINNCYNSSEFFNAEKSARQYFELFKENLS
ncbi:glycosyltransferase [uncultured Pantoea sp.]|uniref:glycosyltransferase n=1 Tax=uncultured Pantoea sp. TaxID=218084 RepID=UPI0025E49749|nr:glycosyltransferase [uncultured Pantoea sp.]